MNRSRTELTVDRELIERFIDAAVNDPKIAIELIESNPRLRQAHWNLGQTALHFLVVEGFTDAVELCLQHGFDPNARNEFGDTPLVDAAVLGNESIVRLLINHGADPNAVSDTKDCPLHCCVLNGDAKMVDLLLSAGSHPYYTTVLGETIFDSWPADAETQTQFAGVLSHYGITRGATRIIPLDSCPDFSDVVAEWVSAEWGVDPEEFFGFLFPTTEQPGALLAVESGEPIGVLAYKRHQGIMQSQAELWVNLVYVLPAFRRRGVGRQLVQAGMNIHPRFGDGDLFAYTDVPSLYLSCGWTHQFTNDETQMHTLRYSPQGRPDV